MKASKKLTVILTQEEQELISQMGGLISDICGEIDSESCPMDGTVMDPEENCPFYAFCPFDKGLQTKFKEAWELTFLEVQDMEIKYEK